MRICRRKRCRISGSKSGSSSTARILAGSVTRLALMASGSCCKLLLQQVEIDRLGDELGGAELARLAAALVVAIGRHHDHRQVGVPLLDLAQQRQPVHAGHVDVGQDDDQLGPDAVAELVQRLLGRMRRNASHSGPAAPRGESAGGTARPRRLVIDDQDADTHLRSLC